MRFDKYSSPVLNDGEMRLARLGALGRALALTFVLCAVGYVALVTPAGVGGLRPQATAVDRQAPAADPAAAAARGDRDEAGEMPGADPLYVDPVASSAG